MTQFAVQVGNPNRQRASRVAGFAAATIASAALIGWWVSLPLLSSWGPGLAPVKPVSALCLVALGLSLVHPGKNARFAFAVGLGATAVSMLDLFGVDFDLNRWLVPQAAVLPGGSFRVINGMPLAIALASISLVLSRFEDHQLTAAALSGLAGVMAVFALVTYLGGILTVYGSVMTPALPTAVGLLCVVAAILLRIGVIPALHKPRPLQRLQVMLGCAIIVPLMLFSLFIGFRITDASVARSGRT